MKPDINRRNSESMRKARSLIILTETILLIPLFWIAINYFSLTKKIEQQEKQQQTFPQELQGDNLKGFCNEIDFSDSKSKLNLIFKLEQKQKEILKGETDNLYDFPDICETALNQLRILAAPELAKEGKTLEAIRILCNIPNGSEFLTEAAVWLDHWYHSSVWSTETKLYLQKAPNCPAGKVF